jgi:hypothetical protein
MVLMLAEAWAALPKGFAQPDSGVSLALSNAFFLVFTMHSFPLFFYLA